MADREALKKRLDQAVVRLNDIGPDVVDDWGGSILFKAPDLNTGWFMQMAPDGTVESLEEKLDEEAATSIIEAESDILLGILNGDVNPQQARAEGKMRADKALDGLALVLIPVIGPPEE